MLVGWKIGRNPADCTNDWPLSYRATCSGTALIWLSVSLSVNFLFFRYVNPSPPSIDAVKLRFSGLLAGAFFKNAGVVEIAFIFGDTSPSTRRRGVLSKGCWVAILSLLWLVVDGLAADIVMQVRVEDLNNKSNSLVGYLRVNWFATTLTYTNNIFLQSFKRRDEHEREKCCCKSRLQD